MVGQTFAQEPKDKKDLKVGLVLSGGGAKGLAHVTILKVLEEAGVRVDYISGTSMGAIVGSLYASGYNATQLDSIMRSIDFDVILSDNLPRRSKPFYEKEGGEKYALILPITDKKIGIPKAISEGQNVLNMLTELTQHVNHITDFRKLPIPFVCVATDLETGEPLILDNGFLPEAVKASGSFPTLLAPVEIDGKLLTDGGIVNNFPVDEVIAMGADIIIGVDIQSGLGDKEELNSALKIMNQIVGFQMYKTLEYKYDKVDLLIKPDMKNFNVVSFDKIEGIFEAGEIAATEKMEQLKQIAKNQTSGGKRETLAGRPKNHHIDKIEIEGNNNYTRAYILGKLNIKKKDTSSYKMLVENVNNLFGTGNFENIQFKIEQNADESLVKFKVKEHRVSNFLKLGLHYDDLYKTGILLNITSKHVLYKNDVISGDLILGDNLRYNLNYFIDNGFYTSFGIRSRYNSFQSNVRFDDANINRINLQYEDFTNQIYFQTVFNRKFAIGVGAEAKRIKAFTETISSLEDNIVNDDDERLFFDKSNYYNLISYMKLDTYDRKYFQKEGFYLDVDLRWYLASSDYNENFKPFSHIKGKVGLAHTFFDKVSMHVIGEAGSTIGDNENTVLDFNIGGYGENFINNLISFNGYDLAELNTNTFVKAGLTVRYEFLPKNYISTMANYARVDRNLFNSGKLFENNITGFMVGYGLDTFIGPIEVNYTWSPDHEMNYWHFNIGYWF
jgi:NTE family protein